MCTVTVDTDNGFFRRTLDLEFSYNESICITPRNKELCFLYKGISKSHFAFMGVAHTEGEVPLYYDGINEHGLCCAALSFPGEAVYHKRRQGRENLASFEVIPYILSGAKTLYEARELLKGVNITDDAFSKTLSPTPLHWIIADAEGCAVLEQTQAGTHIYENPLCVMTNSPSFPYQRYRICEYLHLTADVPKNNLIPTVDVKLYSRGMGCVGMPGDFSSSSRFVRALFLNYNSNRYCKSYNQSGKNSTRVMGAVEGMHIMECVSVPMGCAMSNEGKPIHTVYTACIDMRDLCYYYTTYQMRRICAVRLSSGAMNASEVTAFALRREEDIFYEN